MEWRKIKLGQIAAWVTAAGAVYYAFTGKTPPAPPVKITTIVQDALVPVKVELSETNWLGDVVYLDGRKQRADAYGMATYRLEDQPALPASAKLTEKDYPIVVFFNASGFDSTGDAVVIRRAADGTLLWADDSKYRAPARRAFPRRDGTFGVVYSDGSEAALDLDRWYRQFVGERPQPTLAPPLEIRSPAQPAASPAATKLPPNDAREWTPDERARDWRERTYQLIEPYMKA